MPYALPHRYNCKGADLDKRLLAARDRGNLVFIIGTGFSAAATGGVPHATWRGLIENGIDRAQMLGASNGWTDQLRNTLAFGFAEDELEMILGTAASVVRELKKHDDYAFAKWLKESVGELESEKDFVLAKRLRALPFPILTTNYDTLLENGDRRATDWTKPVEVQQALIGESRSIVHLHGVWNNPESVIFTDRDYDRLLESDVAQKIQLATSTLKSIVYVGFGAGLSDPNFSKMIDWHRTHFVPSGVEHFRLCLTGELAALRAAHGADQVIPLAYGDKHEDLSSFISELAGHGELELSRVGIARDVIGETQSDFADEMKVDAILGDAMEDIESLALSAVVLPPVLIPVPHAEYLKARTAKGHPKIDRLDPVEEVKSGDVLIIAAEENSGLTTAIKWLTLTAAEYVTGAAPIYVSFHTCKKSRHPLDDQIRVEAQRRQLIGRRNDLMPPYVLGLDNFSPYVERISDAALSDIAESDSLLTVVGCVQGVEEELVERLNRLGITPRVRYLGKLSAADVRSYARLVSPSDYENLADQVLLMLRVENLARTPFTVSLLLSVLIQGGKFAANASQTSILDDYIGLLLGRGDPHDDARFGLDQRAREVILGGLAQAFVEAEVGGLSEIDVQNSFQATFDKYGWAESTSDVLASFLDRRVLRRKGKHIEFSRSSFLHLFAAKRAILDHQFRNELLRRPIYYSSAIADYAALFRHDADLLAQLGKLLRREYETSSPRSVFERLELATPRLNERGDQAEGANADDTDDETSGIAGERDAKAWEDDLFDASGDEDLPPFPTVHEDEVPPAVQLFRTLDLVSTVLRDSDQIEDLALKQEVLTDVLEKWGLAIDVMREDASFHEYVKNLIVDLDVMETGGDNKDDLVEELGLAIPAAVVLGGVGSTLASKRLTLLLARVVGDNDAPVSEASAIIACFFHYSLGAPGWPKEVMGLLKGQSNIWIVRNFLLHLLIGSYQSDEVAKEDAEDLLELCVAILQRASNYRDETQMRQHGVALRKDLEAIRLRARVSKRYTARAVSA